eukprot:CAMPEP_0197496366 /NCGR_PEP_ID=MMETSP1311-20131121/43875_1 /TAXON_ID=464262 /ORGANISM="Genus nov. species nov., Strain RCC856" /LENGTH=190 /DNA_ID=CAMNT_0043041937 /DNA_START=37 /DNA_END=609 /DNA_ORIENTATION=-
MAGGSAKKLQKENNARLNMLQQALLMSAAAHFVIRFVIVRDLNLANLHESAGAWFGVVVVNALSWMALSFLRKVANAGTSLTPGTMGGNKGSTQGVSWWIENLQDVVLLAAGFNVMGAFSMKAGAGFLTLIPLYCGYLLLRSLTSTYAPSLLPGGAPGSDEALALEEQEQALQAARKAKKRAKVSKNKTR